jgi:hypothetical protein
MATTSTSELEQAWKERCQKGTFSPAILGLGTIRIMGRSGDAAIQFPRIASLDALGTLEPDEAYAVQVAQRIVEQSRQEQRTVFAVAPGQEPERLTEFKPDAESLMVVARIAGG